MFHLITENNILSFESQHRHPMYFIILHHVSSVGSYHVDPLSSTPTHDPTIPLETNVTLSSTKSNKKNHSVFTFDEQNVYSQHPTFVSDPRNANPSVVQEITGELEERKVNVVDDYLRMTLHRVKDEAQLSEVEYGKLIMMIECGQLVGICDLLEDCLLKWDLSMYIMLDTILQRFINFFTKMILLLPSPMKSHPIHLPILHCPSLLQILELSLDLIG